MDFVKMEGLGNDFVVVGAEIDPFAADIAAWCDRRLGVGADGVLAVWPVDGSVRMRYWNSDGTPAEMCGNGLRCVARYAVDHGMVDAPSFDVLTDSGRRSVEVRDDGTVRASLGRLADAGVDAISLVGYDLEAISLGNPHAVAFVADCYSVPVSAVGPVVEGDPHFPKRTNVEFATVVSRDRIDLRVWERGSGETRACGTGAAAAAAVAFRQGRTGPVVTVMLPGGPLGVEIDGEDVWIDGPARTVFAGRL